jgi:hypothetical protein
MPAIGVLTAAANIGITRHATHGGSDIRWPTQIN